ncbi:pilus assembly protein [Xinfangfangia sp. D13-10-4-6]|uniref:TadE/TadG family type IV pilus assembly protein n=1 Tax=Pseudogemmobacter hezensis TaxID=2737662 RepID=UPI001556BD49|nr:TadE family protein [Pseudogemmobacter hezensis]NPD15617.1 pilus assembly protein [Pseudogemmobacter hezensis]
MNRSIGCVTGLSARVERFTKSEDGVSTIEFIFWVPIVTVLMVFITNATLVLQTQTLLFDAARDAARSVATNSVPPEQAAARVADRFPPRMAVKAEVTIDGDYVTTVVRAEYRGIISIFGSMLGETDLTASVTMWKEPGDAV